MPSMILFKMLKFVNDDAENGVIKAIENPKNLLVELGPQVRIT